MKNIIISTSFVFIMFIIFGCQKSSLVAPTNTATSGPNTTATAQAQKTAEFYAQETATMTVMFVTQWGSFGTDNGQFNSPQVIAVDNSNSSSKGDVYVADMNNRIQKFTSVGGYITQLGNGGGTGIGQFCA